MTYRRSKKLSPEDVADIKRVLWRFSHTHRELAQHYGVRRESITKIQSGETWAHVPWPDGSIGPMSDHRALERRSRNTELRVARRAIENFNDASHGIFDASDQTEEQRDDGTSSRVDDSPVRPSTIQSNEPGSRPAHDSMVPRAPIHERTDDRHQSLVSDQAAARARALAREQRLALLHELAQEAEQEIEEDIWSSLHDVRDAQEEATQRVAPREAGSVGPMHYAALPWDDIKDVKHPLIAAARQSDALRRVLCIALEMLPRNHWTGPKVLPLCRDVATSLQIDINNELEAAPKGASSHD